MRLLLPLLLLLSATGYGAEIHQWRDANGTLHFGDQAPANVRSERVEVQPNIYASPPSSSEQTASATAAAPTVTLYSTTWCGYCTKARNHFRRNGIAFNEYDVETSRKGQRDYARFGANGVPVILVGSQRLQGFSIAQFDRAFTQQ